VVEELKIDTWGLVPPRYGAEAEARVDPDGTRRFTDEYGCRWVRPQGAHYYSVEQSPLADCDSIGEAREALVLPDPTSEEWLQVLRRRLDAAPPDRAVVLDKPCAGFFEMPFRVRGHQQFFIDFLAEPELADMLMDAFLEFRRRYWEAVLPELGDRVDVVVEANDIGGQEALLIRPEQYRRRIKPRERRLFETIRRLAPHAKILYHCDGAIRGILPDFIEVGVDVLNPLQLTAAGMEARELKAEFGDRLCFWGGGVDTQQVLPHGTPQQVRQQVKDRIEALAPGGGFVFTTVHNVQADVPPENFWAMWEALQEHGAYR
jgi:uroporphyrinogen decarboxylase